MIRTFDFVLDAKENTDLMTKIKSAINENIATEICTDIHRILFKPSVKIVRIEPLSKISPFSNKIIPTEVSYKAIVAMLDSNWAEITEDDICYINK